MLRTRTKTDMIRPTINSDARIEDPPEEMNGSGLPVVGRSPVAQAMFKNAWATSITVRDPAIMQPKLSGA